MNTVLHHPAASQDQHWHWLFLAWLITLVSTLGALFLGEVMGMTPCVLCWYQRIAMFPLVLILGLGLLPFDARCVRYALPLAALGWLAALYHSLLFGGWIPKGLVPCGQGASCTDVKAELFGFLSLPLLSLGAFSLVIVLLLVVKKGYSK
jgi:disulfide bond formation protein DsbB